MAGFPNSWMWSEACDMLTRAERMHREFFRPARARMAWEPPVDVLETEREVLVFMALPGVEQERVEAAIDGSDLVVGGTRVLHSDARFIAATCACRPDAMHRYAARWQMAAC